MFSSVKVFKWHSFLMTFSGLQTYLRSILVHISWGDWAIIGLLSSILSGYLLIRKKLAVYSAVVLGITVFFGLVLLNTAVVNRCFGTIPYDSGLEFTLHRLFHCNEQGRIELFFNFAAFVPFGFFLSKFLFVAQRLDVWRRIVFASLVSFGLSLIIECLQLVLRVGCFELTDLVLNTIGGFIGASMTLVAKVMVRIRKKNA